MEFDDLEVFSPRDQIIVNYGIDSTEKHKRMKRCRKVALLVVLVLVLCFTIGVVVQTQSKSALSNVHSPVLAKNPVILKTFINEVTSNEVNDECSTGDYYVNVDGTQRKFKVYNPSGTSSTSSIIFVWHGITASPDKIENKVKMHAEADANKWVVVYPYANGFLQSFNGRGCCDQTPHDTKFAEKIIEHLQQNSCASENSVYSCGFSNGGFMGHELGCSQTASSFKAIAVHSGLIGIYSGTLHSWDNYEGCNGGNAPAFFTIHGSQDTVVPYNGGQNPNPFDTTSRWYSFKDTVKIWRKRSGCQDVDDTVETITDNTECLKNTQCKITNCTVSGLSHDWSAKGTELIVAFFKAHGA